MSRTLGGRTNLASRARRIRVPPPIGSASVGEPCLCGQPPTAPVNLTSISGSSFLNTQFTCQDGYIGDHRIEATVNAWGAQSNSLGLNVRVNLTGPDTGYGYTLEIITLAPSSYANAEWTLLGGHPQTTIGGPTTIPRPAPGDMIELSAVGTAVAAKLNGGTVLSATDSSITTVSWNYMIVTGGGAIGGNMDIDVVYQDYCP